MDGILQTGTVIIDKKTYELDTDGSLKGYTPKKKSSKKKSSDKSATSDKSGTSTAKKSVALTFDDGPSSFTDRLLDCLEENNAKATFFMVGTEIASFPDGSCAKQTVNSFCNRGKSSSCTLYKLSLSMVCSNLLIYCREHCCSREW